MKNLPNKKPRIKLTTLLFVAVSLTILYQSNFKKLGAFPVQSTDSFENGYHETYTAENCLRLDFIDVRRRKRIAPATERADHTDPLGDNQIIFLDETVALRENRQDVIIKLYTQQDDEHTQQIGKEETRKLRYADVPTQ